MKHLLNQKSLSKLTTTIVVCLWSLSAWSGSAIGIHDFGPDITENQSCEIAKLKATKQLIENELGVVIQVNDLKTCINDNCELNSFKWITFPGIVHNSKYITQIEEREGKRFCVAQATGTVISINKQYAEGHDFSAVFNKNGKYFNNDHMQINIFGESKQYYKIFLLNDRAVKIFPNSYENGGATKNLTVPSTDYNIRTVKEENPNEIILIVSHTKPFKMNTVYNIKDFGDAIMQMKQDGFRVRMYDITIQ